METEFFLKKIPLTIKEVTSASFHALAFVGAINLFEVET